MTHARAGLGKWLSASFSPDGRRVTAGYTRVVNGQQQDADVFVFGIDGGGMRNVTRSPDLWESALDLGTKGASLRRPSPPATRVGTTRLWRGPLVLT